MIASAPRYASITEHSGYIFLATEENRSILEENHALQTKLGADILFLEPLDLVERFPWLSVAGLSAGCWGMDGRRLVRRLRLDAGVPPQGTRTGRCLSVSGSDRRRTDGRPCQTAIAPSPRRLTPWPSGKLM